MPRQLRIQYEGAIYHVMCRGDRREAIFFTDGDRRLFIKTLGEACGKTGWEVLAWVLMGNHYHLVIRTPQANLVRGMQWMQTTFSARINRRHGLSGHLFGGRYKAVLIEPDEETGRERSSRVFGYLGAVIDYVHLNPVRAGLVRVSQGAGLAEYAWSSLVEGYLRRRSARPQWMKADFGLRFFGLPDTARGRRAFLNRLEIRARAEAEASGLPLADGGNLQATLRRGWYFGSEAFKERMLALAEGPLSNPGRQCHESALIAHDFHVSRAEAIIADHLREQSLTEEALLALRTRDPRKVILAARLRKETTVTFPWIASRLKMGSPANVLQALKG